MKLSPSEMRSAITSIGFKQSRMQSTAVWAVVPRPPEIRLRGKKGLRAVRWTRARARLECVAYFPETDLMNKLDAQRQKEIQQAEELLFAGPQALGFAKGLFQGHFVSDWVMPYPRIPEAQQGELDQTLAELRKFLNEHLDPAEIDRQADIPREVIDGLGCIGVLGMTAPKEYGGRGFSQMANCKVLEEIGRRCASTSVFVNAHHSIGIRALLLFRTHEQKQKWLPKLVTAEQLGSFALTEKEAGSDAANVQMQARPSEDGSHFIWSKRKSRGSLRMLTRWKR